MIKIITRKKMMKAILSLEKGSDIEKKYRKELEINLKYISNTIVIFVIGKYNITLSKVK